MSYVNEKLGELGVANNGSIGVGFDSLRRGMSISFYFVTIYKCELQMSLLGSLSSGEGRLGSRV